MIGQPTIDLANLPAPKHGLVGFWSSVVEGVRPTGTFRNLAMGVYDGALQSDAYVKPGSGLVLDGTSYRSLHSYTPLVMSFGTRDHTFQCWFKTSTLANQTLMCKISSLSLNGTWLYLRNSNPYIRFLTTSTWTGSMNIRVDDNVWHFVTGSRIGTTLYVFLDGRQVDSQAGSTDDCTNSETFVLGARQTKELFTGNIDMPMVYNGHGITLAEHQAFYHATRGLFGV